MNEKAAFINFTGAQKRSVRNMKTLWPKDDNPSVFFSAFVMQERKGFFLIDPQAIPSEFAEKHDEFKDALLVTVVDWSRWLTSEADNFEPKNSDVATVLRAAADAIDRGDFDAAKLFLAKLSV